MALHLRYGLRLVHYMELNTTKPVGVVKTQNTPTDAYFQLFLKLLFTSRLRKYVSVEHWLGSYNALRPLSLSDEA